MGKLDDILQATDAYKPVRSAKETHPSKEWTPGIDTEKGEIVVRVEPDRVDWHDVENAVDWSGHLRSMGLNPDHFTIEDPVEFRTWDGLSNVKGPYKGAIVQYWYFKAKVRRKRKVQDLTDLVAEIRKHRPLKRELPQGDTWLVVCLADWQLGKRDQGGSEAVVTRVLELHDAVTRRVKELQKTGTKIGGICVAGMGDIVEGCKGFYPNQPNQIDLDRREQTTVARRLILKLIRTWSGLTADMLVLAVPGNHGENRNRDGTVDTVGDKDNDDLAVFEQVAEILAENPDRYGHVRFVIPNGDESVTVDLAGQIVGFTHGHKAGAGGPGAVAKQWTWWQKQTHAMRPVGDATLLVTAHFHHLVLQQQGPRTHVQCPALEGGSDWYAKSQGYESQPGTLTFTIDKAGWDNLQII